ncbi:cytochrome c oxidase assembly protein COX19 [Rhagoletis pomonella]|uniref:cytochrome c oxidase assembly protein COX19 n=1 Tax=Rhagoletis pomonella TaxID=28610 RepID=UPI00177F045F|nr:cytochrome c oxidase assembly protein COX19 [Rhagoletis pomonella]
MNSNTLNQKSFIPTPPEKGSFPLDHENICKKYYLLYMSCLRRNSVNNSKCRLEAKEYLGCRMQNNLMEQTQWSKLGFEDEHNANANENTNKN